MLMSNAPSGLSSNLMPKFVAVAIVIATASFTGCVAVGSNHETNPPTLGHELIDLQSAFDKGAISLEEYEQGKSRLMSHYHAHPEHD